MEEYESNIVNADKNYTGKTVIVSGIINRQTTTLTSNTLEVNVINGLTAVKSADKTSWADGALTYTLTINNTTGQTYTSPVITDTLDTTLVTFVPDSVTINGSTATSSQYTYNNSNGLLTVNLSDIATGGTATVTFKVTKNN